MEDIKSIASKKLDNLGRDSSRVILDIKAIFPFNFFPDEIIVDETKVSIYKRFFLYSKEIRSLEYSDVFSVVVQHGPLFAHIVINDRYFAQDPIVVEFLRKKDAILLRRIILGLMIAKKEKILMHTMPIHELRMKLEKIGKTR